MTDYTRLLGRLSPKPDGESPVRHRSGVVDAVNTDGTVDVDVSGVTIPGVAVLDGAIVGVADTVQIVAWAGDLLVLGRARETQRAGGILDFVQVTSGVGGITTVPITLASTTVLFPPNRWIRMTGSWPSIASTVAGDRLRLEMLGLGVQAQQIRRVDAANFAMEGGTIVATFQSGTGGNILFTFRAVRQSGTGTFTVNPNIDLAIEDRGAI